jgi:hypothetical protein
MLSFLCRFSNTDDILPLTSQHSHTRHTLSFPPRVPPFSQSPCSLNSLERPSPFHHCHPSSLIITIISLISPTPTSPSHRVDLQDFPSSTPTTPTYLLPLLRLLPLLLLPSSKSPLALAPIRLNPVLAYQMKKPTSPNTVKRTSIMIATT